MDLQTLIGIDAELDFLTAHEVYKTAKLLEQHQLVETVIEQSSHESQPLETEYLVIGDRCFILRFRPRYFRLWHLAPIDPVRHELRKLLAKEIRFRREGLTPSQAAVSRGKSRAGKRGRKPGASLSKTERDCIRMYREGMKPSDIDERFVRAGKRRSDMEEWEWGTAQKVIKAAKARKDWVPPNED